MYFNLYLNTEYLYLRFIYLYLYLWYVYLYLVPNNAVTLLMTFSDPNNSKSLLFLILGDEYLWNG